MLPNKAVRGEPVVVSFVLLSVTELGATFSVFVNLEANSSAILSINIFNVARSVLVPAVVCVALLTGSTTVTGTAILKLPPVSVTAAVALSLPTTVLFNAACLLAIFVSAVPNLENKLAILSIKIFSVALSVLPLFELRKLRGQQQ